MKEKKFDVCLMNPPYTIANTFFAKVLETSVKTVTIQPISWLFGKKKNMNICRQIEDSLVEIDLISSNGGFDASFLNRLSIVYIDKFMKKSITLIDERNNKKLDYNSIYDVSEISLDEHLLKFHDIVRPLFTKDNFLNHKMSNYSNLDNDNSELINLEKPIVRIPLIRGHVSNGIRQDDFYTIISNNEKEIREKVLENTRNLNEKQKPGSNQNKIVIYFICENEEEQKNIVRYLKTDFCRACLMLIKTNATLDRGELKYIPWLDFNDSHFKKTPIEIDDWLFEKYKISDEIRQHIEEILPDYYKIRKENRSLND